MAVRAGQKGNAVLAKRARQKRNTVLVIQTSQKADKALAVRTRQRDEVLVIQTRLKEFTMHDIQQKKCTGNGKPWLRLQSQTEVGWRPGLRDCTKKSSDPNRASLAMNTGHVSHLKETTAGGTFEQSTAQGVLQWPGH